MDMTESPLHEWVVPFRELLNVQKNYLKCSGIWIIDPKRSSFLQSAYLLYKGWMLSAMYIFVITLFADIYDNVDNLSITTDDGCIFAGMLVVIFKAMNYQIRRNKIARFVGETLKCADDLSKFSNAKYVKCIVEKYQVRNKVLFYGFTVLGCVLGIALLFCSPMENGLPIRAKYPFDTTKPFWHRIGLFIETCAVCGGLVAIVAMDSITVLTSSIITMLFDILNLNFENCSNRASNDVKGRSSTGTSNFPIILTDFSFAGRRNSHGARLQGPTPRKENKHFLIPIQSLSSISSTTGVPQQGVQSHIQLEHVRSDALEYFNHLPDWFPGCRGRRSELGYSEVWCIPKRGRISAFVYLLDRKRAELFELGAGQGSVALGLASRTFARRRTTVHIVHDVHQTVDYFKSWRILRVISGNIYRDCKEILFGVHFTEQHAVDGSLIGILSLLKMFT